MSALLPDQSHQESSVSANALTTLRGAELIGLSSSLDVGIFQISQVDTHHNRQTNKIF